jgi:hypothetical protein
MADAKHIQNAGLLLKFRDASCAFQTLPETRLDRPHGVSSVHYTLGPIAQLLIVHAGVVCCDEHKIEI